MGKIILFALILFFASFLNDYYDRLVKTKALEASIDVTINLDWRNGIPFSSLVDANAICLAHTNLPGCTAVENQMADIASSLQSCLVDQQSQLCNYFVDVVSKHPIFSHLPSAKPQPLPNSPFFWDLPTHALNSLASNFGYRAEALTWWWGRWRIPIVFGIGIMLIIILMIVWLLHSEMMDQELAIEAERQRVEDEMQETIRCRQLHEAEVELARCAKIAHEDATLKSNQLRAAKLAEQNSIQLAAKLAADKAERAEAALLLSAVFKSITKTKKI